MFSAALVLSFIPPAASALSEATREKFAQNNIVFYDPEGEEGKSHCVTLGSSLPVGENITWIGDSYTVGAQSIIEEKFVGVDIHAQASKHFSMDAGESAGGESGLTILRKIKNDNALRPYLVFALGTNDNVPQDTMSGYISSLESIAGNETKIILVTAYTKKDGTYTPGNTAKKEAANTYDNIFVADWAAVADNKYYERDELHPIDNGGYQAWVDAIAGAFPSSSANVSGSSATLYDGTPILDGTIAQRISDNQQFYESASASYGIDWKIIATIHIKENSALRQNPSNGQGAFQLYTYTAGGTNSNAFLPAGNISDEEFIRQIKIAIEQTLLYWINAENLDLTTEYGIKRLFFHYNGTASAYISQAHDLGFTDTEAAQGEGSPYVMNVADENRDPRRNPNWKIIVSDGGSAENHPENISPGAWLYYLALGGNGSLSGSRCVSSGGGAKIEGGLTEAQAQRLADYYKSDEVSASEWNLPPAANPTKWNCVSFSAFFTQKFTSIGHYKPLTEGPVVYNWGNGRDTANYLAQNKNLTEGNAPQPFTVYSVYPIGYQCDDGMDCGHTGIIVGVDGDSILTVQAAYGSGADGVKVIKRPLSFFKNSLHTYYFTYLSPIMDLDALYEIVGRE